MNDDREQAELASDPKEHYRETIQAHFLEQYKLFVESAKKVTDRRITGGNYVSAQAPPRWPLVIFKRNHLDMA